MMANGSLRIALRGQAAAQKVQLMGKRPDFPTWRLEQWG
jgi:hypothetical protein